MKFQIQFDDGIEREVGCIIKLFTWHSSWRGICEGKPHRELQWHLKKNVVAQQSIKGLDIKHL